MNRNLDHLAFPKDPPPVACPKCGKRVLKPGWHSFDATGQPLRRACITWSHDDGPPCHGSCSESQTVSEQEGRNP